MSKVSKCCGALCNYENDPSGPCWGEVEIVEEYYDEENNDHWWIHACEGHADMNYSGEYLPKPTTHGCKHCECKNKKA